MDKVTSSIKRNLTVPNFLTLLRIVVIIPLVKFLLNENYIGAGVMMLISAVSDMFDGLIARKFNLITQLGKILDPIADKLTLIAVVICINILYPSLLILVIVLFCKELLMLSGGCILLKLKIKPPAAKWYGKMSTAIFYTSVVTIVLFKAIWNITNKPMLITMFAITTAAMIFSLVNYAILFFKLIQEREKKEKDKKTDNFIDKDI